MKKQIIFEGCATALITPFSGGHIDYASLEKIIEFQIGASVDALVVCGTTGEVATLCDSERYTLYEFVRDRVHGRTKLIFGTGTNDTRASIKHTRVAERIGCDGVLCVHPYYNKGTEEGLYEHYKAICEECGIPVLLYNVPSRTGGSLSLSLIERLCRLEGIVGIKEACDSVTRLCELSEFGEDMPLYSGADAGIYSTLALGGHGVISVISNAYPKSVVDICRYYREGEYRKSLAEQIRLMPMIRAIFSETSPAPIKYLMHRLGYCENELRLPLSPANNATRVALDTEMQRFGKR